MRTSGPSLALCFLLSALGTQVSAQQLAVGSCDLPLVVTYTDNALVRDLGPKDIQIHLGAVQVTPESLSIDSGPKRVALIIDASSNVPQDEWSLETAMARIFVDYARPGDTFALFVVGKDSAASGFLPPAEVQTRLQTLASSRPPVSMLDTSERTYDAISASLRRLDPPLFGDAVFIFGHDEDSGSSANPDQLLEMLLKDRVRLFGISFSDPLRGRVGFDPNRDRLPVATVDRMSLATGNYFSFHTAQVLRDTTQLSIFENFLGDLYARIAQPYRLRIPQAVVKDEAKLQIQVTKHEDRNIRSDGTYYPPSLYPCAPQARKTQGQ